MALAIIGDPQVSHPTNVISGGSPQERDNALLAWLRYQADAEPTEQQRKGADRCKIELRVREIGIPLSPVKHQERALGVNIDTAGGYLVNNGELNNGLEIALLQSSAVRRRATVVRTPHGATYGWPLVDDTSVEGILMKENTCLPPDDNDLSFKQAMFSGYKYSSKRVEVPYELVRDAYPRFVEDLGRVLGERIGRITNRHYTSGDGAAKPLGVETQAPAGATALSPTAITSDEIYDLIHSVDPGYLEAESAAFMMHSDILKAVRKLKGSNGRYVFKESVDGRRPTLAGFPVELNRHMPSSIAAGNKTILFGAFEKVVIRDGGVLRVLRLDEPKAECDSIIFVAFLRTDSQILDAGTHPIKALQQAAA